MSRGRIERHASPRRVLRLTAALSLMTAVLLVASASAQAAFGVAGFDGEVVDRDGGGIAVAATQAGTHPDEVSATIDFRTVRDEELSAVFGRDVLMPDGSVRDIWVDLPAGFVGNPMAAGRCTDFQLNSDADPMTDCPPESQVGMALVESAVQNFYVPVYNMVPPPGVPGAFGFRIGPVPIHLRARVRSGSDYGLSIDVTEINQAVPMTRTRLTFWGVPADPSHDAERKGGPTAQPRRAFLSNPTYCNGPVETRLRVRSWRGETDAASFLSHHPAPDQGVFVGPEGCDRVPFDIALSATPQSVRSGAPSGYTFEIEMPQSDAPEALANSHLRRAVVKLPTGVSITPPSAAGLEGCPDASAAVGSDAAPSCPEASKIGTVEIDTPLLERTMTGAIHLLEPKPGNLFRLLLVAEGPGVLLKLPGDVRPDHRTGQLTATFDNNPQLPFTSLRLAFKGGPRAPLVNPPACGTYTTTAELTSWSGKIVTSDSSFAISHDGRGAPCPPRGFTPDFSGGLANPVAGTSSTFTVAFGRDDDDQTLRDITVAMPEGLTGVIASATLCGEPQAAAGTCGESSRIGSTVTGAGAGSNPLFLPGRVYITGPYKGAPFGMSIVVPAVAGPFDLGTVVVRAAIFVDPETAQLRVVSDPLPTILEGVPLLIRSVEIAIDKPGFMLAPTSCRARRIDALLASNDGATASAGARFQVGDCGALPYRPRLALRIGAKGRTRGGGTTPLTATLTMPRGAQANNRSIGVTLPIDLNSRLESIRGACTVQQFRSGTCGRSALVGSAVAVTPLLRDPLRGPVYIVRPLRRGLPSIGVNLRGQVDINLVGIVRIVGRDLLVRTTFEPIPDVPVSKFRLSFVGGRQAPVGLVRSICSPTVRRRLVAQLAMRAQSGRLVSRGERIKVAGCDSGARARSRGGSRATKRRPGRRSGRS